MFQNLLLFVSIWAIAIHSFGSVPLVAVQVDSKLPSGRFYTSAQFDGLDSIYIFGGVSYNAGELTGYSDILQYSISNDSISLVGSFPEAIRAGSTSLRKKDGVIFYIGGDTGDYLSRSIYGYDPSTSSLTLVTQLPYMNGYSAAVTSNEDQVFIFGGVSSPNGIIHLNLTSLATEEVGNFSGSYNYAMVAVAEEGGSSALLFGNLETSTPGFQSVSRINLSSYEMTTGPEEIPAISSRSAAVNDGNYGYVIGGYWGDTEGGGTDSIIEFDPTTMKGSVVPVASFPVQDGSMFFGTSAVYVDTFNRIYWFGGTDNSGENYDGIWFIQLGDEKY